MWEELIDKSIKFSDRTVIMTGPQFSLVLLVREQTLWSIYVF